MLIIDFLDQIIIHLYIYKNAFLECRAFKSIFMLISFWQIKKLADLGILGVVVDKKYGGSGADSLALSIAVEEISR